MARDPVTSSIIQWIRKPPTQSMLHRAVLRGTALLFGRSQAPAREAISTCLRF